jgi:hypothetical protein
MVLLDLASLAGGLPAWATLAAPLFAPTAAAPLTSSVSSPSDLALAQESPASSLRLQHQNTGPESTVKLDFKEAVKEILIIEPVFVNL